MAGPVSDPSGRSLHGTDRRIRFKITAPTHYRIDSGPTGTGAMCTIVNTDHGNARVIKLYYEADRTAGRDHKRRFLIDNVDP